MTPDALTIARTLEAWGHERGWAGTDPYDGLNATRLAAPLRGSIMGRRVLTQLVKRSPVDLRPMLGIRPGLSPASLAYVASAHARGVLLEGADGRARLTAVLERLLELRCDGYAQPCWGYHFDVQTRVFFYPFGSPNTIATAFAGIALVDAFEATGEARWLDLAMGTAEFFLEHVPQTADGAGAFFGYLAGDRTPIHNASLLVCALLARVAAHRPRPELQAAAQDGVTWTTARQRPDGSWPYGEQPHLNWVDGFHTGYVLDALQMCGDLDGARTAYERGLEHYRRELFLADGTAKYKPDSVYPVDVQCVAQGIQTFARAGDIGQAHLILGYAERELRTGDGLFAFQRRPRWVNRAAHVRWVVAPMLLALTELAAAERSAPGGGDRRDEGVEGART